ncbi:MAG: rod shape-determining protein [Peptoniphilaceae bacterium]|nr:rod shape-determining protein [Peptoniphilaceae bacterium]MDY5765862.1 rod shape-determining protein [Peptoniphilaceae bacterium]
MDFFHIIAPDLAIDLGTANTTVVRLDNGKTLREPTVIALDFKKMEILAVGQEAKNLTGKSPENVASLRPLEDGAISDFDLTQALLEYHIHRAVRGISIVAPRVTISIPSGATDVEMRAIQDACLQSGARDVYLVEEALASAYGADLVNDSAQGAMVLNIGAGTTQVAVVNSYGVITSETMKRGGNTLDRMIRDHIREKYDLVIGDNTAEELKITIGTLREANAGNAMEASGRDTVTGMPKSIDVYSSDLIEAIQPFFDQVVDRVRLTLEKTPPELAGDIMKRGLFVTGGTSQIDGLDEYIATRLAIRVVLSGKPLTDTIDGTCRIMKNIDQIVRRGEQDDSVKTKKK